MFVTGLDREGSSTLLDLALAVVGRSVGDGYTFTAVRGATQARVWRGTTRRPGSAPDLALRLTPKPVALVLRIRALIDQVHRIGRVDCPRTILVEELQTGH